MTAVLLTLLYLSAGMFALPSPERYHFEMFVSGTGYLVILSLILIWFGVNQWRTRLPGSIEKLLPDASADPTPVESGLRAAMAGVGAGRGAFVWARKAKDKALCIRVRGDETSISKPGTDEIPDPAPAPFLYDLDKGRALMRDAKRNLRAFSPADVLDATPVELGEGLAIPIRGEAGEGQLYLEEVRWKHSLRW